MKILQIIIKNWKAVLILGCAILIIVLLQTCDANRQLKNEIKIEAKRTEQNMKALNDSVEIYKNKKGEVSYDKAIAKMSKEELEKYNPELFKAIKDEGGKVTTIINSGIEYRDTGSVKNVVAELGENHYSLDFDYVSEDSIISTKGKSLFSVNSFLKDDGDMGLNIIPGITKFIDTKLSFRLTTGIKKDKDGIDRIFITPSSNKLIITDIQGANVTDYMKNNSKSSKPKKYSLNVSFGYSAVFGKNNQLFHGPGIQIGIGYNIIRF